MNILLALVAQVVVALEMATQEAPLLRPLERLIQVEAVVVAVSPSFLTTERNGGSGIVIIRF
jgi:hypothetical protein